MPEISRFFRIIVTMYYDDHNPPHFHVRYNEHKAEISISNLSLLAGKLPPRVMGLVMEWASIHQAELIDDWKLACEETVLKKIAPLELAMFLIDVVGVRHVQGHQLELKFADGLCAEVDMGKIIKRYSGVFLPLKDDAYFAQVRVDPELGTIIWPNGADVCPDVLYSYASGLPIVVNGERVLN